MKLIRPMLVNDTALVSSNVLETAPSAYSSGTTYALGDTASVTTGTVQLVYKSLQSGNIGHTPASSPTWWEYVSTTYAAYSGGTTYALDDKVSSIATNVHQIYQSLKGSNTGNALTDATSWLLIGATNPWAMFDGAVQTQSVREDSIDVQLRTVGRVESVALLNVSAASLRITMTDATDGVVYDETTSLISNSGIIDSYAYCFEPIIRSADFAVTGLPPYSDSLIEVILTDTGSPVMCGECIIGFSKNIGDTQYGVSLGIQDYSIKQADAFGNFSILERAFSKIADLTVWVPNTLVDELVRLLAQYRATPIVYIGSDGFPSSIVYGFYKDQSVVIQYVDTSVLSIQLESLT